MVVKIPYTANVCPHCGKELGMNVKDGFAYGSPIRTCKHCSQPYLDRTYHEIEIDGYRPGDLDTKGNGKMILGALAAAIVTGVLFVLIPYTILLIAFLLSVVFFFGMILETVKVKTGKRKKELEKLRQESESRLCNREYAQTLKALGYNVPEKYL